MFLSIYWEKIQCLSHLSSTQNVLGDTLLRGAWLHPYINPWAQDAFLIMKCLDGKVPRLLNIYLLVIMARRHDLPFFFTAKTIQTSLIFCCICRNHILMKWPGQMQDLIELRKLSVNCRSMSGGEVRAFLKQCHSNCCGDLTNQILSN